MDNHNLLTWLLFRYPHFSEYPESHARALISQGRQNTRMIRTLIGVMFILSSTLLLFLIANTCQLEILMGYQGLALSLLISSLVQLVTTPLNAYMIKSELSSLISHQKV